MFWKETHESNNFSESMSNCMQKCEEPPLVLCPHRQQTRHQVSKLLISLYPKSSLTCILCVLSPVWHNSTQLQHIHTPRTPEAHTAWKEHDVYEGIKWFPCFIPSPYGMPTSLAPFMGIGRWKSNSLGCVIGKILRLLRPGVPK